MKEKMELSAILQLLRVKLTGAARWTSVEKERGGREKMWLVLTDVDS